MLRRYARDIIQRAQGTDLRAMAADWQVVGVDLSYWQGAVDFDKLAGMVDFALLRAGYGNDFIDPRLEEYRQGCIAHGIPFGLYWYAKPGKDFSKHALNFFSVWEDAPGAIYPVFDLEENGGLAKTALESWLYKMYSAFNGLSGNQYPDDMTYTSPGFANTNLPLTNWLKRTVLWVAHWTTAGQPTIPNEWAVPGFTWRFWQWSATGKGSDYGVSSRYVDLNRYNGTKAQFLAEFGITPPPPPPPEPDPLPDPIQPIKLVKVRRDIIDWANVRAQPSLGATDLGDLMEDSVVPVVEVNGDWYRIDGWIHKDYVTEV
jgi:GH25 family lysozyme M1 (1,4-beta-N-acetylmuramidase)